MILTQTRELGNGWSMQMRIGGKRTIWKLCYNKSPLPFVFYSEGALLDWAEANEVNYSDEVAAE
jgi:hypothetical protein